MSKMPLQMRPATISTSPAFRTEAAGCNVNCDTGLISFKEVPKAIKGGPRRLPIWVKWAAPTAQSWNSVL